MNRTLVTQLSEISVKTIKIPDTNDIVELYLIDCSGKDIYRELLKENWGQANLIAAVYDATKEDTFGSVAKVHIVPIRHSATSWSICGTWRRGF